MKIAIIGAGGQAKVNIPQDKIIVWSEGDAIALQRENIT